MAFNMSNWFGDRKNGREAKTSLNIDGFRTRMDGLPAEFTDSGLAQLADGQDSVRIARPRTETETGIVVSGSKVFAGKEVGTMLRSRAGLPIHAPKNRIKEDVPSNNGAAVS